MTRLWLLKPLLFLVILYAFCFNPIYLDGLKSTTEVSNLVPHIPTDPHVIVRIGQLSVIETKEALDEVSVLVGWRFQTHDELKSFIDLLGTNNSILTKIWNLVSVINLIILVGIIGMTILFVPVLNTILGPLVKMIWNVILQIVLLLLPFWELLGYFLCDVLIIFAAHAPPSYGKFTALLGSAFFSLLFTYSCSLHDIDPHRSIELKQTFYFSVLSACFVPQAILFDSDLFGFIGVVLIYSALGFVVPVRFENDNVLKRCASASAVLIPAFVFLKPYEFMEHYITGVYVLGTTAFYIGMLILASKYHGNDYGSMQMMMIASLMATMFLGMVYDITSLCNVTVVFGILYGMEKFLEFPIWNGKNIVIPLFAISFALYKFGIYLHTNPQLLTSLYSFAL